LTYQSEIFYRGSDVSLRSSDRRAGRERRGWFTEGFDTADLKDAKALLEELA
jgi:hypothetical protein